jgi:hypothetical protein
VKAGDPTEIARPQGCAGSNRIICIIGNVGDCNDLPQRLGAWSAAVVNAALGRRHGGKRDG